MRIGIDYRFLSLGPYQASRGMGRFTQQQLREVLRVDASNEYLVCCPAGADTSLIEPQILAAPNASVRFLPADVTRGGGQSGDDTLERVERLQAWVEQCGLDVFHATTPMIPNEPVAATFDACPLVATVYDVIPLVFPDRYLADGGARDRYLRAVALLLKADRVIAISRAAGRDAFHYLGIAPDRIDVAYPVADPVFRPLDPAAADAMLGRIRAVHGLPGGYVMAVTHLHHSKNPELLFRAFAMLPATVRRQHPLVLCCELDQPSHERLRAVTDALGITADVVVTGMVTDEELAALYGRATLVVHPSRYEGFGLPVLEAMRCGVPVVTTTSSSLPEVSGGAAVLVDPDDPGGLARAILDVVGDDALRARMAERGLVEATRFGNDQLGRTTLESYRKALAPGAGPPGRRPRVAMWTPVPPQQSGIADYSAELVDELAAACDIELFVDSGFAPELPLVQRFPVHHFSAFERRERQDPFDVTVYQMGNSHFHLYMYDAIRRHPGVVVLHDMAWSQVLYRHLVERGDVAGFLVELAAVEGADAARAFHALDRHTPPVRERARLEFLDRHPMLGSVVSNSLAQVVHFDACRLELTASHPGARPYVVEMGVADPYGSWPDVEVGVARARLGLPADAFVVGSFGIVHPVKRLESCLRAVARLVPSVPGLQLLVVGRMAGWEYEQHLQALAADLGIEGRVRFTGHVSKQALHDHLIACDVVVNLRTPTHQHMSATIARAVAAGKPVLISDFHGWSFLTGPCFVRIPVDDHEVDTLVEELGDLAGDPALRNRLARAARERFETRGSARHMAAGYLDVIERIRDGRPTGEPADAPLLLRRAAG